MKAFIQLIFIIILSGLSIKALCQTGIGGPPTCPSAYTYSEAWDWWTVPEQPGYNPENWRIHPTGTTPAGMLVYSPFAYPSGIIPGAVVMRYENTRKFWAPASMPGWKPDCLPEDGWIGVYKKFGTPTALQPIPCFMLYNRYTGVLRVFAFANKIKAAHTVQAIFRFNPLNPIRSANLAYLSDTITAIDNFEKKLFTKTMNQWQGSIGEFEPQWFFVEVPLAYDPCVCKPNGNPISPFNFSEMELKLESVGTSTVDLKVEGRITGKAEVVVSGSSGSPPPNTWDAVIGGVESAAKHSKRGYDSPEVFRKYLEDVVKKSPSSAEKEAPKPDPTFIQKLPEALKFIPQFGFALGLMDFFTGGGAKKKSQTKQQMPINLTVDEKITGSITTVGDLGSHGMFTPGSRSYEVEELPLASVPAYNYPLGVINLMATPVLEFVDYTLMEGFPYSTCESSPTMRQYRLRDPIRVVVNPMAGLTLTDLKAEIVYQIPNNRGSVLVDTSQTYERGVNSYPYGPMITRLPSGRGLAASRMIGWSTFPEQMLEGGGIVVRSWTPDIPGLEPPVGRNDITAVTFSTGYVNADCLPNQSIIFSMPPIFSSWDYREPRFGLRIMATMRRNDADAETEDVFFIGLFRCTTAVHATGTSTLNRYNLRPNTEFPIPRIGCEATPVSPGRLYKNAYVLGDLTSALNPGGPAFPLGSLRLDRPTVVYIPDGTVFTAETTITASREIIIGNNVSSTPGSNVTLIAPSWRSVGTFDFQGTFDFRTWTPLQAETWVYGSCASTPPATFLLSDGVINTRCGNLATYNPFSVTRVGAPTDDPATAAPTALLDIVESARVYPNPFTDNFTLDFQLKESALVTVELTNALGQTIRTCCGNVSYAAGSHSMPVDGRGLAPGTYFAKILIDGAVVKTVPLMKVVE
jgi:hypothetical protein